MRFWALSIVSGLALRAEGVASSQTGVADLPNKDPAAPSALYVGAWWTQVKFTRGDAVVSTVPGVGHLIPGSSVTSH